jgi:hypothetical protein
MVISRLLLTNKVLVVIMLVLSVLSLDCRAEFAPFLSQCESPELDLNKMTDAIKSLSSPTNQTLGKPHKLTKDFIKVARINHKTLPMEVQDVFFRLQDKVFGRQIFTLASSDDINFSAAENYRLVMINPDLWNTILNSTNLDDSKTILRFILSHELGHHVQEMIARKNKSMFSVNNLFVDNDSIGEKSIDNYIVHFLKSRGIKSVTEEKKDMLYEKLYSTSHLEVDAYGYLILKMAGGKVPSSGDFRKTMEIMMKLNEKEKSTTRDPKMSLQMRQYYNEVLDCEMKLRYENLDKFFFDEAWPNIIGSISPIKNPSKKDDLTF